MHQLAVGLLGLNMRDGLKMKGLLRRGPACRANEIAELRHCHVSKRERVLLTRGDLLRFAERIIRHCDIRTHVHTKPWSRHGPQADRV